MRQIGTGSAELVLRLGEECHPPKKSRNGCAQEGAVTTTRRAAATGSRAAEPAMGASAELESIASFMTPSVPELTTVAPVTQSATPRTVAAEPAAPGAAECAFCLGVFAEVGASGAFESAGMKIDSDSGEGLMDGFLMCSKETPTGMDLLLDPSLESASVASLSALGT